MKNFVAWCLLVLVLGSFGCLTVYETHCVPGESKDCAGPGCTGYQVCENDGQRFGACICDGNPDVVEDSGMSDTLIADSQGRPLPRFTDNGPVPAGQLFLVGTHPRSYDSRYFGFVDAREILHQALPLW